MRTLHFFTLDQIMCVEQLRQLTVSSRRVQPKTLSYLLTVVFRLSTGKRFRRLGGSCEILKGYTSQALLMESSTRKTSASFVYGS